MSTSDPRTIWKDQDMTPQTLTHDQLEARRERLDTDIRRRNRIEYAAGAIVAFGALGIAGFILSGGVNSLSDGLAALGMALIGLAAPLVAVQLHRRAAASAPIDGSRPSLEQYRADLARQRDALDAVWLWYVAPFVPGLALVYASAFLAGGNPWLVGALAGLTAAFLAGVVALNRHAARALAAEHRRLDG